MKQCTSNLNVLNQYFSNLAESFELTCKELKFLNQEKGRIQELKTIEEEERTIKLLIRLKESKRDSFVSSKFTIKELKAMRDNFNMQLEQYAQEEKRINLEYYFWKQRYNAQISELTNVIIRLKDSEHLIKVIYESEVKMLLAIYREKSKLENCRIIDCSNEALMYFPDDELSEKFINAYYLCDEKIMQNLAKKYIDY